MTEVATTMGDLGYRTAGLQFGLQFTTVLPGHPSARTWTELRRERLNRRELAPLKL
ncbi:MAG TPA: hypothetical protein VLW50_05985 [Streptosporangiaceae bacterium]|nr:hypothetical protein [Streptosporangiaceae bacterium]